MWHRLYRFSLALADTVAAPFRWLSGPWVAPDPWDAPACRLPVAGAAHGDPSYLEVWAVGGRRPGYVGLVVALDDAWWLAGHHAQTHGVEGDSARYEVRRQVTGEVVWDVEVVHATPAEMAAGQELSEAARKAAAREAAARN